MKTKLCGWVGCNCLTTDTYYCAKHKVIADQRREERNKQREKSFATATRFADYNNSEWRKLSRQTIKEVGHCERCGSNENLQVHHIIPIRNNPGLFLVRENLIVLCRSCHAVETRREIEERR